MAVEVREAIPEIAPETHPDEDAPIRPRSFTLGDAGILGLSALSAFSLLWLLFYRVVPLSGAEGFVILWFATFLAIYYVVDRELEGPVVAKDRVMAAVVGAGA